MKGLSDSDTPGDTLAPPDNTPMQSSTPFVCSLAGSSSEMGRTHSRFPSMRSTWGRSIPVGPIGSGSTLLARQRVSPTVPSRGRQKVLESGTRSDGQSREHSVVARHRPPEGVDSSVNSHTEQPPVSEGETLQVEIEGLGEQGDGLARGGPGYVVFVSDTEVGQQPLVGITAAARRSRSPRSSRSKPSVGGR